jgi:hypothetical protein
MLIGPINSGVAAGGAGVATATGETNHPITGLLYAVYVKYNDAPPATTDVTVKTKGTNPPSKNLLVVPNAATDGEFLPRLDTCKAADATALAANDAMPIVSDIVQVVIAGANNGDSIDVWLEVL